MSESEVDESPENAGNEMFPWQQPSASFKDYLCTTYWVSIILSIFNEGHVDACGKHGRITFSSFLCIHKLLCIFKANRTEFTRKIFDRDNPHIH